MTRRWSPRNQFAEARAQADQARAAMRTQRLPHPDDPEPEPERFPLTPAMADWISGFPAAHTAWISLLGLWQEPAPTLRRFQGSLTFHNSNTFSIETPPPYNEGGHIGLPRPTATADERHGGPTRSKPITYDDVLQRALAPHGVDLSRYDPPGPPLTPGSFREEVMRAAEAESRRRYDYRDPPGYSRSRGLMQSITSPFDYDPTLVTPRQIPSWVPECCNDRQIEMTYSSAERRTQIHCQHCNRRTVVTDEYRATLDRD